MKRKLYFVFCIAACLGLASCASEQGNPAVSAPAKTGASADTGTARADADTSRDGQPQTLKFVDAYGDEYETEIAKSVPKNPYDWGCLRGEGTALSYADSTYRSRLGIDVSEHNGDIDWGRVGDAGVEFAFVRVGYRAYGESGLICEDSEAMDNIQGAEQAGIDVGVYFFSQAIDEAEAVEEAEFVLEKIAGMEPEMPVVYDPESIQNDTARTDNVSGEQFTKNTIAFCDKVREAGYTPMVYSNMLWEAFELDLSRLTDIDIWYADYEPLPQTPYYFSVWQYSESGSVDGMSGDVDLDIQFCR